MAGASLLNRSKAFLDRSFRRVAARVIAMWTLVGPPLVRLRNDESGSYLVIVTLAITAFVGFDGLGSEAGLWLYTHMKVQGAADSGALSAARRYGINFDANCGAGTDEDYCKLEAEAIAAEYGVTNPPVVNRPPKSGNFTTDANAIEVLVNQQQTPMFSVLSVGGSVNIAGRAVAILSLNG